METLEDLLWWKRMGGNKDEKQKFICNSSYRARSEMTKSSIYITGSSEDKWLEKVVCRCWIEVIEPNSTGMLKGHSNVILETSQ